MVPILIPLFYLLLRIMGRRLRPLAIELQQANATTVAASEENLGMLLAIKTFTREAEQSRRYRQQIHQVRELSITQQRIYAALEPAVQFIAAAAVVLLQIVHRYHRLIETFRDLTGTSPAFAVPPRRWTAS